MTMIDTSILLNLQ